MTRMSGSILWKFPTKMKILFVLFGLAIALLLFREQWLSLIGSFLIVQDSLQPVDVIHTIAGDDYRTDYAIRLYKQGYAKTLFFTGGWCKYHGYYHGQHALERAVAQGVPAEAVAFDDSAVTSTFMETELLKKWIDQGAAGVRSIMVVSDPFHMRRARWTSRKVFEDAVEVRMAPVPFEQTPYRRAWWMDRASQRYVRDEYQKFVYYVLRYQLSGGGLQDWLKSLDRE